MLDFTISVNRKDVKANVFFPVDPENKGFRGSVPGEVYRWRALPQKTI
jgi:hypothetical protein